MFCNIRLPKVNVHKKTCRLTLEAQKNKLVFHFPSTPFFLSLNGQKRPFFCANSLTLEFSSNHPYNRHRKKLKKNKPN